MTATSSMKTIRYRGTAAPSHSRGGISAIMPPAAARLTSSQQNCFPLRELIEKNPPGSDEWMEA